MDTVTLSSGTLAQSPVARQPFMGKLMSVAPLAGSLWMLRTVAGSGVGGGERQQRQTKGEKDRAVSGSGASALGREVGWDHHGAAPGSGQLRCTWGHPATPREGCAGATRSAQGAGPWVHRVQDLDWKWVGGFLSSLSLEKRSIQVLFQAATPGQGRWFPEMKRDHLELPVGTPSG